MNLVHFRRIHSLIRKCSYENNIKSTLVLRYRCFSSLSDVDSEYRKLVQNIARHNQLYHNQSRPIISDLDYDKMVAHKMKLEHEHPTLVLVNSGVSTTAIGATPQAGWGHQKCHHEVPMLSLDNCFDQSPLSKFVQVTFGGMSVSPSQGSVGIGLPVSFVVEPKVDGLSLSIRYDHQGKLIRAVTRGDGTIGENVTANCAFVSGIPQTLPAATVECVRELVGSQGMAPIGDGTGISPARLEYLEVRGEVYIANAEFATINSKRLAAGLVPFSTPRNAAAGGMRLMLSCGDTSARRCGHAIEDRKLRFFSYQLVVSTGSHSRTISLGQLDMLLLLQDMGFAIASPFYVVASPSVATQTQLKTQAVGTLLAAAANIQQGEMALLKYEGLTNCQVIHKVPSVRGGEGVAELVWASCKDMEQLHSTASIINCSSTSTNAHGSQQPYAVDGAVVKVNNAASREELGSHSSAPRWALAYKFAVEQVVGILDHIAIQVGRTGALTPVAKLRCPVNINNVSISQASLHNEDEVNRLRLRPGAEVVITRAGDVIPQIVGVVPSVPGSKKEKEEEEEAYVPYCIPRKCPVCWSEVVRETVGSDILSGERGRELSVVQRCSGGVYCLAQRISAIEHYCSKAAADIRGLGPSKIRDLVYMGKVTCAADLYEIESQERSCSNKGVESSRYVPYSRAKTEADADVAVEVVVEGGTGGFDIEGEVDASDDNNKNTLRSTDTDTDTDTLPPQQRLLEEYSYSGPLANVTGYQSKSLQNLFQAIESRRILPMYRFIYGIGLRYVGLNTCKLLEREFGSFQEFWNMVTDPSRGAELALCVGRLPGVGARVASSLSELSDPELPIRRTADRLLQQVRILDSIHKPRDNVSSRSDDLSNVNSSEEAILRPLEGKIVVFTGGITHPLCGRTQNSLYVEQLGGKTGSIVSGKTNILIVGDKNRWKTTTKLNTVLEKYDNRIDVWSADQWISLLLQHKQI